MDACVGSKTTTLYLSMSPVIMDASVGLKTAGL